MSYDGRDETETLDVSPGRSGRIPQSKAAGRHRLRAGWEPRSPGATRPKAARLTDLQRRRQANQLTVNGTDSKFTSPTYYFYDKNGSLTNLVEPTGATYFAYNSAGLVARMRWRDASATYFFYDGALRRYGMNAIGTMTYFLWNGPNLLQELNLDGTVKDEHTNAMTQIPGIAQLVQTNRPGQAAALQKIYPIMDMRGTITKWVESDGSTILASQEYDSFGTIIPNSPFGTWPNRFGYQGQAWMEIASADGKQRFLLSPTRIYDPSSGRFTQRDPLIRYVFVGQRFNVGESDFNLYQYAQANPTRLVDSRGFQSDPVGPDVPDSATEAAKKAVECATKFTAATVACGKIWADAYASGGGNAFPPTAWLANCINTQMTVEMGTKWLYECPEATWDTTELVKKALEKLKEAQEKVKEIISDPEKPGPKDPQDPYKGIKAPPIGRLGIPG